MITLQATPNPFEPYNRQVLDVRPGSTVRDCLRLADLDDGLPAIVSIDGVWVLRAEWERPIHDGAQVRALRVVAGGKNGAAIISIAEIVIGAVVSIYAPAVGVALIAGGVVGLAASLLIQTPRVPSSLQFESGSPAYSLDVTNRRRIGEPIPVLYGTHRLVPDLIANPYTEYDTNDQYLYLTLCLGQGDFQITETRIAESLVTALTNFQSQVVAPGGSLTLFPDNVTSSSLVQGQGLRPTNDVTRLGNQRVTMSFSTQHITPVGTGFTGITAGDSITLANCASAGTYTVTAVGTGGSYLAVASGLVSESPNAASIYNNTTLATIIPAGDVTFTASSKTITDPTKGRFVRWKPGDVINITGTASNNITATLATVSSDGLSATTVEALVNESGANPDFVLATGGYVGPFPVNAAGTTLQYIGVDIILPKGLMNTSYSTGAPGSYYSVSIEIQAQPIDSAGSPTGIWTTLATETITRASLSPVRVSFKYTPPGPDARWQVRARRTTPGQFIAAILEDATWAGLRGYLPTVGTYPGVTIMGIRVKATDQIPADVARQINIVATRKLPIWNGTSWSANTATRNPAWAIADALRNSTYGAGLADNRIDLAKLLTLANTWTSRGDYFDGVFDQTITLWEALQRIARAGRAVPIVSGGLVTFVRDDVRTLRTALYSPATIKARSLSIEYSFAQADDPDGVDASYIDPATWQPAHVQAMVSGGSPVRPASVDLFGVTNLPQAQREALYVARVNAYQRKVIRFTTEMDGFIPLVGDMIAISHDVPAWGQSGAILGISGTTYTTSEPLAWTPLASHYVALRRPDGSLAGPFAVTQGADDHSFICAAVLDFVPRTDLATSERTVYLFGAGTAWAQDAIITHLTPRSETEVEITCQPYDARIYAAGV